MNEEEAKTKWCPFVRLVVGAGEKFAPSCNRMATTEEPIFTRFSQTASCIASECMAWRWIDQQTLLTAVEWVQADPTRNLEDFKPRNPTNGYCGLAGKP